MSSNYILLVLLLVFIMGLGLGLSYHYSLLLLVRTGLSWRDSNPFLTSTIDSSTLLINSCTSQSSSHDPTDNSESTSGITSSPFSSYY